MKSSWEALLDRMEPSWTKRQTRWLTKPTPWFWARMDPRLLLEPTDNYPWRVCLRLAFAKGAVMALVMAALSLLPLVFLWRNYPDFLRRALAFHGSEHAVLIRLLAHEAFYQTPAAMLFLVAFAVLLELPFCYFWNRRAARLRREGQARPDAEEQLVPDATIWPPAPESGNPHREEAVESASNR